MAVFMGQSWVQKYQVLKVDNENKSKVFKATLNHLIKNKKRDKLLSFVSGCLT